MELVDANLFDTAIRELQEETGLPADDMRLQASTSQCYTIRGAQTKYFIIEIDTESLIGLQHRLQSGWIKRKDEEKHKILQYEWISANEFASGMRLPNRSCREEDIEIITDYRSGATKSIQTGIDEDKVYSVRALRVEIEASHTKKKRRKTATESGLPEHS